MNSCDNLKKRLLSRSIVYSLIDNAIYSEYHVVNKELHDEIQKLSSSDQIDLMNFMSNISFLAYEYISYSVTHSACGQLVEARNIRVNFIEDRQLYEMIVVTFVTVVFEHENKLKLTSLIELCINDGTNFNRLIDTCLNLNYLDVLNTSSNKDETCQYASECEEDYDEGYDSVS